MRILNVGSNYRVEGGSDRYFLSLEALLEARGHTVVPFVARHPDNLPSEWASYFPPGVDTESPGMGDAVRFVYSRPARAAIDRLLADRPPDLAHLHVYYGQLTASILGPLRERGVPIVQTLHDSKLACPVRVFLSQGRVCEACDGRHFWKALPRRCNRGSLPRTALNVLEAYVSAWLDDADAIDRFIAPSRFLERKMVEHGVTTPDRITVIPNFVDPAALRPAHEPGEHLIYVGRIRAAKGIETLVTAAGSMPGVPLLVVGSGRDRAALERRVESEGWDHIRFLGFQEGEVLHDLIRRSVAVVVPSELYENCPMAVLEAMALGRPVVASAIGGIPELVAEGGDGLLFPPGSVSDLRERLEWMVSDRRRAAEMGAAARRKVESEYTPAAHYDRLMAVYDGAGA